MRRMLQHIFLRLWEVRMKILLDENFPLALVRKLREQGHEVEHIILLGLRGTPDSAIVARLNSEALLFLTHDQEFLERQLTRSSVIVSRVSQGLPLSSRIEAWLTGLREYFAHDRSDRVFELFDNGSLLPSQVLRSDR
jgi:hypothetical protein